MDFEKDIFISYAHIDDATLAEGTKGWIAEFHRSLEVRLSQLLGTNPVIWRDAKLQGNDFFGPEIVAQFPKLKVLVSIVSPRYVKSEWCQREVEEFSKAAEQTGGIAIENKSRIFKIVKTPVKQDEQFEPLRDMLGYEFYKTDSSTGRFKELGRMYGQENEQAYWTKLDDVAHDIAELIEKINNEGKKKSATTTTPTSVKQVAVSSKKIYLSGVSLEMKEYRENIKRELESKGYSVVPDKDMPYVASPYINEVNSFLQDCILSIHLVGTSYGLVPEGTTKSIVQLQNEEAARKSSSSGMERLIWITQANDLEDERQEKFIAEIKQDSFLQQGADLIEGTLEDFKFSVFDTLKKMEEKKHTDEPTPTKLANDQNISSTKIIYLVCDKRDLDLTKPLEDFLFNEGFEIVLPIFEGDESQLRHEHEENLKLCDGLILFYGHANELWLRSMTRDMMRMPALGRQHPLLAKMAFVSEPITPQKERFRSHELTVVNGTNGFTPSLMNEFISKMKKEK